MAQGEVAEIEHVAFAAWPAAEVEALGGWRLRFNRGVTQRASSVWPGPAPDGPPLAERLDAVERWYETRGAQPLYQISPAAEPAGLDAALAARGYPLGVESSVEVADAARVAAHAPARGLEVECAETLGEDWFELSGRRGRFRGDDVAVYRALLGRLAGRAGFVLVRAGGEPAAAGLGVVEPPWAGVFSMLTLPPFRGRGLGAAVLGALARWASRRGARRLYLQVEVDNATARRLYARAGFAPRYAYHYRKAPAAR